MPGAVEIRAATVRDMDAIAALLDELNRAEGYAQATDSNNALMQALFGDAREVQLRAMVAVSGEETIGVLLYYPGYDTLSASYGYHLADMVVTEAHRQSGVGRQLMHALATHTLAEKKEWVSLTVLKRNIAARAFYQALGMTEVAVDFFALGKKALAQL